MTTPNCLHPLCALRVLTDLWELSFTALLLPILDGNQKQNYTNIYRKNLLQEDQISYYCEILDNLLTLHFFQQLRDFASQQLRYLENIYILKQARNALHGTSYQLLKRYIYACKSLEIENKPDQIRSKVKHLSTMQLSIEACSTLLITLPV